MMNVRKALAILGLALSTTAASAPMDNPVWPWQCGSKDIGDPHEIIRYLRLYPSKATAIRNPVLHRPDNILVLPFDEKHDDFDILTGFVTENSSGVFRNVVYIADPIKDDTPLSIVVPLWFPNDIVDMEDFKLRNAAGVAPNLLDPDNPTTNSSLPRGGGMGFGATNYPCIVRIGDKDASGMKTLVYLQGYVHRTENLASYFSPL